jgi:tripartite-type tricarboxylate transporter receptor subunit TctC
VGDFVPGYEMSAWYGIGAPKGTPAETVDKLNNEINSGLADPGMTARLASLDSSAFLSHPLISGNLLRQRAKSGQR